MIDFSTLSSYFHRINIENIVGTNSSWFFLAESPLGAHCHSLLCWELLYKTHFSKADFRKQQQGKNAALKLFQLVSVLPLHLFPVENFLLQINNI